jgi:hypothetical protein
MASAPTTKAANIAVEPLSWDAPLMNGAGVLVVSPPLTAVGTGTGVPVPITLIPPGMEEAGNSGTEMVGGTGITVAVDTGKIVKVVYLVVVTCRVLVVVDSMVLNPTIGASGTTVV